MPLVQDHLKRCGDCREEYETLSEALKMAQHKITGLTGKNNLWKVVKE
jgi:predicted anti-sigma-YlaC factor YlaD